MEPDWAADFSLFFNDMGERPDGFTLERIDVNKGYVRGNCIWIEKSKQNMNKRNNHLVTYKGKTQNIAEWAKETGVSSRKIQERLGYDWELDKVFSKDSQSLRHNLTLNGKTMCVLDWSKQYNIQESTIRRRLKLGWSVEQAITTPVEKLRIAA